MVRSLDDILKIHFGKMLSSEGVHILDPFTGTGTFIVRTLEYFKEQMEAGEISLADITRKFTQELHANEIILLSYYIAAINIESTFDEINGDRQGYLPFDGIVLTDTFSSSEDKEIESEQYFIKNNERISKQREIKITAVLGNPPYSIGQSNANEDNQNISHPILEQNIRETYASNANSKQLKTLYDYYIKAFRWSTNKIKEKGVISFVTNNSFLDSNSTSGFRGALFKDFNYIYIVNLKGNQRVNNWRKEGGKVFDSDSQAGISIIILVKTLSNNHKIFYHDIGDYLSRREKLDKLSNYSSINEIQWLEIIPNNENDWINQRDEEYSTYYSLLGNYFEDKAIGVSTNRDEWVYDFDTEMLDEKVHKLIRNYNHERIYKKTDADLNTDDNYIKWSEKLKSSFRNNREINKKDNAIVTSMYRPFCKKKLYYQNEIIERPSRYNKLMKNGNKIIYVTGKGSSREFSALMIDVIPNMDLMEKGQGFYLYTENENQNEYKTNITDNMCEILKMPPEDVFYYVYGVFHSQEYKDKYQNELKKDFPKIPLLKNKLKYVEVGKKLAELHLNYENVNSTNNIEIEISKNASYKVEEIKFDKKITKKGKKTDDLSTIIFNSDITIRNIPLVAYDYIVNGKSAIHWIIEMYKVSKYKKLDIINDPNKYSNDEKYILNLLISVISLSIETINIMKELPNFELESEIQK